MVKLRPYVVAVNHVTGCPRLESGQGGRRQGHRRCAPGCERVTKGWEVDLALRLPDGTPIRERVKAPVTGKSAALRWAQVDTHTFDTAVQQAPVHHALPAIHFNGGPPSIVGHGTAW